MVKKSKSGLVWSTLSNMFRKTAKRQYIHKKKINTVKKQAIPKRIKALVWNKYVGEKYGIGKCYCCRKEKISQMNFHCGHVMSESHGGKLTIANLRPICSQCNLSMGTKNMKEFINDHSLHKRWWHFW
jgi:5-methylcytosine-specific restriction endonuclease McrA